MFVFSAMPAWPQHVGRIQRQMAQVMLQDVASDVRKYYYDPKLHGLDWDAKVSYAKQKISSATDSTDLIVPIASILEDLDDSHTFFVPPRDPSRVDYGWRFEMVGTRCFVTNVRAGSDADAKRLKPGDEVLTIDGFTLMRASLSKLAYDLNILLPQPGLRVVLRDRSGMIRQVDVMAKVTRTKMVFDFDDLTGVDADIVRQQYENEQHLLRPQYKEFGEKLLIVKLPIFAPGEPNARELIDKARGHEYLILDLRDNPGGAESALTDLLSAIFQRTIKIADRKARAAADPLTAKGSGNHAFTGKVIVLVDSRSASAAELFARTVQIEKRGIVLGDRTSGSVMEAKYHFHVTGSGPVYAFAASVTSADLIMRDGNTLEHTGVIPDETILPTASDLAYGRDPVMARAAAIAGVKLSPEDAAKLFSYEWPTD